MDTRKQAEQILHGCRSTGAEHITTIFGPVAMLLGEKKALDMALFVNSTSERVMVASPKSLVPKEKQFLTRQFAKFKRAELVDALEKALKPTPVSTPSSTPKKEKDKTS